MNKSRSIGFVRVAAQTLRTTGTIRKPSRRVPFHAASFEEFDSLPISRYKKGLLMSFSDRVILH